MAPRKILVCGGGNGAHCCAALTALLPNTQVRVLTLYGDEASRWQQISEANFGIDLTIVKGDGKEERFNKSKLSMITNDPQAALDGVNIIFMVVPAFAHEQYLTALAPHIQPNTIIIGMPGQAGFEFQCRHILGSKVPQMAIVNFESLPWACRIIEFGKHVKMLGCKETLGASLITGSQCKLPFRAFDEIQVILGEEPKIRIIQNYIAITLMTDSVHPAIMYGKWGKWDGTPLPEKPLFYQGIDEIQAEYLTKASDEMMNTAKAIEKQKPDVKMDDVIHIFDWYKVCYKNQITDDSCLMMAMRTNKAYDGLIHPMKEADDGKFVPDFDYRYLSEDIPYGVAVIKGIAELAGVETPIIDEIMQWCQGKLNKEYIVGNKLNGANLNETRSPQRFGFKSVDDLFNF